MIYKKYVKRFLDLTGAIIIMPLLIIVMIIVGPLIILEDGGSIFYKAQRRGLRGRVFEMYKFRSMMVNAPDLRNKDNSTYNSPNDPRITKIGKILRKTSIDEIPQIINVLKGDMSFIGPRPVTIDRPLKDYDRKRRERLNVRPGITGYSQAYYRNAIDQERKLYYDAQYAKNVTFIGDMKILFKTVQTVLLRKNVYIVSSDAKKFELHEVK